MKAGGCGASQQSAVAQRCGGVLVDGMVGSGIGVSREVCRGEPERV